MKGGGKIIRLSPSALAVSEKLAEREANSVCMCNNKVWSKTKDFHALKGQRHSEGFVDLCAAVFGQDWVLQALHEAGLTKREIINVRARWLMTEDTKGSIISKTGLFDPNGFFREPPDKAGNEFSGWGNQQPKEKGNEEE